MKESTAKEGRKKRDCKIIALYNKINGDYAIKMDLYYAIAKKVGCGYNTVITTLQNNGILEPKKRKSDDSE